MSTCSNNFAKRGDIAQADGNPYDAMSHFEKALSHTPNHAKSVVGLSDLLLDIFEQKIPPEPQDDEGLQLTGMEPSVSNNQLSELMLTLRPATGKQSSLDLPRTPGTIVTPALTISSPQLSRSQTASSDWAAVSRAAEHPSPVKFADSSLPPDGRREHGSGTQLSKSLADPAPELLNRLAARDRAYNLLSTLTKLGTGWDYAEAWFSLARAYELSGQIEKAKEVLWWCVELEDSRPLRPWKSVGMRNFAL
jgi:tetratricopeptide (TPR) repeat protein